MVYGAIADKKNENPNKKRSIGYDSGISGNLALGSGTLGSSTFLTSGSSSGLGLSPTLNSGYAPSYGGIYSAAAITAPGLGPNFSGPPISSAPIYSAPAPSIYAAPAVAVSAPIQTVTRNIIQTVPQPVPVDRPYPVPQPYPVVYTK